VSVEFLSVSRCHVANKYIRLVSLGDNAMLPRYAPTAMVFSPRYDRKRPVSPALFRRPLIPRL
jgi:hypothetical protein